MEKTKRGKIKKEKISISQRLPNILFYFFYDGVVELSER